MWITLVRHDLKKIKLKIRELVTKGGGWTQTPTKFFSIVGTSGGLRYDKYGQFSSIFFHFRASLGLKVNFFAKFLYQLQWREWGVWAISNFTKFKGNMLGGLKVFWTGSLILQFLFICLSIFYFLIGLYKCVGKVFESFGPNGISIFKWPLNMDSIYISIMWADYHYYLRRLTIVVIKITNSVPSLVNMST